MHFSILSFLLTTAALTYAQSDILLSQPLQSISKNAQSGPLYTYPTDLTQGILPNPIHSHNDYWRPIPFYSALSIGAISVEADVWLYDETLYVGHEVSALKKERTFDRLYIEPILSVLKAQNPNSSFVGTTMTKNGVYDTSSGQTLYLFVDVKTNGTEAWPHVVKALEPLREAGYLTTYNGTGVTSGPVTVIGTGNTPLNQVQGVSPRDYFYDAPLALLGSTFSNITADVSPIASTAFSAQFGAVKNGTLNSTQAATLSSQIETAREKGIGARYWDQPNWPVYNRNAVHELLYAAGVALLNADDLEGVADL
ncbi:uncharacterized protein MYCFIDRAFT_30409 [Pseudocercospora fijiensis CIRAD86]|uniref:Altered inheritance of mitochondria protein 6 n=1 Tax=Pseudocercospora fijiensis (strain CIRAD86) TaxID=383855 RepID=M3AX14_PSEFD|nr:uncharacterized protein MYCFIDRAFT_30409 [Pseudocercospora fijiensis CIRAD86]EME82012.1 hypothetical protein MYCFIDRAFT_30409 [Pseudocercospora fijiensis CIRAD86]